MREEIGILCDLLMRQPGVVAQQSPDRMLAVMLFALRDSRADPDWATAVDSRGVTDEAAAAAIVALEAEARARGILDDLETIYAAAPRQGRNRS